MPRDSKAGLVERSKRFLGSNRRGPSQPESQREADSNTELTAYQRRRDQVRRAQRSHRERKENYIKGLEQEILELRENEALTVRELESQIDYLTNLIQIHGINLPNEWKYDANKGSVVLSSQGRAMASFVQHGSPSGFIQITRQDEAYRTENTADGNEEFFSGNIPQTSLAYSNPNNDFVADPSLVVTPGTTHSESEMGLSSQIQKLTVGTTASNAETDARTKAKRSDELLSAGINFVLTLEHPCMQHISAVQPSTSTASGNHALLASHQLLAHAPPEITEQTTWQVPEVTIERMLAISSSFDLAGEITPVQAWSKLRNHPKIAHIDPKRLETLKEFLSQEVKCFGFGAVMEGAVFDIAMQELFLRI